MNNVLIGLPDLAKERKLSKIEINLRLPNIYYYTSREFPYKSSIDERLIFYTITR